MKLKKINTAKKIMPCFLLSFLVMTGCVNLSGKVYPGPERKDADLAIIIRSNDLSRIATAYVSSVDLNDIDSSVQIVKIIPGKHTIEIACHSGLLFGTSKITANFTHGIYEVTCQNLYNSQARYTIKKIKSTSKRITAHGQDKK